MASIDKLRDYGTRAKNWVRYDSKDWFRDNGKLHLVDSTALLAESAPIFTAFEVGIAGMSDQVSMNTRWITAGTSYLGLASIFSRGRDISRKIFKINDKTREELQHIHDVLYTVGFNLVLSPPLYYAAGARDLEEIAWGTGSAMLFGGASGSLAGYAVDTFRDLTGMKECNRPSYPNFLKRQSSRVKKTIAAGLVATSIAAVAGIYSLTSDEEPITYSQPSSIEQVVEYKE